MRRHDRELKDFESMQAILEKGEVCHLAIHDEPYPYLVALNYAWLPDDKAGVLYFHSAKEGKKLDLLRQNPNVCFEIHVDGGILYNARKESCTMAYESVTGFGTVSFVEDPKEKKRALDALMSHYHLETKPYNPAVVPITAVLKLPIASITGKKRQPSL